MLHEIWLFTFNFETIYGKLLFDSWVSLDQNNSQNSPFNLKLFRTIL